MSVSSINTSSVQQIRAKVDRTLANGIQIDMSTEESKRFLRRLVHSKTKFVTMFIDINGSTEMSVSLPDEKFAVLIKTIAQETSIVVRGYGGYVFKYEGDAVISLFPAEHNPVSACKNALDCSRAVLEIVRRIINPAIWIT